MRTSMRNIIHTYFSAGLLAAALLSASGFSAMAQPSSERGFASGRRLEGTWLVTVTTYNCQTGVANPPFHSTLAFAAGGVETDTTGNPVFLPGQRSTGIGTWKYTGDHTYRLVSNAYLTQSTTQPLAPPFQPGIQQITQDITLINDYQFTSKAIVQYFNPAGEKAITGCATAYGKRLQHSGQVE